MELRIEKINKYYKKKHALKDFSCVFREGVNVLLGPNGAGKTTLMNVIAADMKSEIICHNFSVNLKSHSNRHLPSV